MAPPISICFLWLLALSPGTALRIGEWVPPTSQYSISEVIPESPPVNTIEAIEKVKKGIGSVWIHHTTHNAGTSLLALFRNHGLKWDPESMKKGHGCFINEEDLAANPGTLFYDDICGESGLHGDDAKDFGQAFSRTSAKLVTVYPFRDPMVRILAKERPGHNWDDQPDGCFTDNYGLRKLLGMDFDTTITKEHIQAAKSRAASFDILADATNFTETLMVICGSFGWECTNNKPELDKLHVDKVKKFAQEHPSLWKTWEKRNAPEIEFYEFAKGLVKTRLELANHQQSLNAVPRVPSEPMALHRVEEHTSWICPPNKGGT